MKFEGVYTPLVTPFHKDFTLNKQAMQASIDLLIDAGIDGLIVAGTEGEYYAMSMKERVYLMRVAKEMIAGRVPMIIGTSAIRTEECIEYARQAKVHAADAVLVTAPPVALPTGPEIAAHVLAIERAAKLPLILHNDPQRLSVNLDESCLAQIVASNPPSALIYNSGNPEHLHMLARAHPQIDLSCGSNSHALEFFAWGARSWVCAGSNFAPEAHIALYQACVIEGDFVKGRAIMSAMLPLMQAFETQGRPPAQADSSLRTKRKRPYRGDDTQNEQINFTNHTSSCVTCVIGIFINDISLMKMFIRRRLCASRCRSEPQPKGKRPAFLGHAVLQPHGNIKGPSTGF